MIKQRLLFDGILIISIIQREYQYYRKRINPNKFKREIEEFVKGFQLDQDVSFIEFRYCPFEAIKSTFLKFILCFPAVKKLQFEICRFSDKNFRNLQEFKNLKLNYLEFIQCTITQMNSFCSFLKSITVKDVNISEHIQDEVIISDITNYLKTNKTIKNLRYTYSQGSNELPEEDIIELQDIVDSHPSILGLQLYPQFIEPKGKSKMLKKLVHSSLQSQYEKQEVLNEVPVMEELEKLHV
eukprot:snap_masked-scaffold_34-processed-gene-3.52-mRNA-1 protein AED:1.00 eAED:1.00 QI:0/0/0/0/1/1/6/0/239